MENLDYKRIGGTEKGVFTISRRKADVEMLLDHLVMQKERNFVFNLLLCKFMNCC